MKKLTTKEVIKRYIKKHGNRYDYSLVDYINSQIKVKIICPIHGVFYQRHSDHLNGCGCKECAVEGVHDKQRKTIDEFIIESWCKHGDRYNYKLVDYKNAHTNILIVCPIHGIVEINPYTHLKHGGCKKCTEERYYFNNISKYDLYQPQLEPYGVICRRSSNDSNILEVKCMYCDEWYQPSRKSVVSKIKCIKGVVEGEQNLYCSDNCKRSCPTYGQNFYPKGFKLSTSREVQPQLRKLVLKRDNYKCVRCGKGIDEVQLHCHHLTGVELNPIESTDVDNCITLCKEHHRDAHKDIGCRYTDLRKSKC